MPVEPDIPPQDPRHVLGELERLQQAIQTTREQRERAKAELATHLSAFDPPVVRVRPPAPPPPRLETPDVDRSSPAVVQAPNTQVTSSPLAFEPLPSLSRGPRELFDDEPGAWEEARKKGKSRLPIVAAAGGLALVAVLLSVWVSRDGSPDTPPTITTTAPDSTPPQTAPSPAPQLPAAAAAVHPRAVEIAIETLRPVWLRVTVDGRTAIEQELPAGTKRTFGGDEAVVLRVGDAGALRLSVGGVDQGVVGKDGQVVTRRMVKK